jgi:hypothetical protein
MISQGTQIFPQTSSFFGFFIEWVGVSFFESVVPTVSLISNSDMYQKQENIEVGLNEKDCR